MTIEIMNTKEALKKIPKGNKSPEVVRMKEDLNETITWLRDQSQDSLNFRIQDLLRNIK